MKRIEDIVESWWTRFCAHSYGPETMSDKSWRQFLLVCNVVVLPFAGALLAWGFIMSSF